MAASREDLNDSIAARITAIRAALKVWGDQTRHHEQARRDQAAASRSSSTLGLVLKLEGRADRLAARAQLARQFPYSAYQGPGALIWRALNRQPELSDRLFVPLYVYFATEGTVRSKAAVLNISATMLYRNIQDAIAFLAGRMAPADLAAVPVSARALMRLPPFHCPHCAHGASAGEIEIIQGKPGRKCARCYMPDWVPPLHSG